MKAPLSWLKQYVDVNIGVEELAHRLTMAGNEVESIERTGHIDNVVVGEVLEVKPHPHADRLVLVTVNDGAGQHEVVCGALNVAAGQKIAFASIGAELFDAYSDEPGKKRRLRRAKIRGVESSGMVCSERELGLGEDHEGILVLDKASPVGTPIGEVIGESVIDLELTPNRPDCLGIVGIARDVAALTGEELRMPSLEYETVGVPVGKWASVTVKDPDLSPRYVGAVIRNLRVGPSPDWLRDRILSLGERPINNVVDATNFVMFELGQPLHAFDCDRVANNDVIVRRAQDGEKITTLDGVERELDSDTLLIADENGGIGLAGVMGGANSEITEYTRNVFLESANFNAENNRRTSRRLGMRSEATLRFEKGLRAGLAEVAIRRCLRIIQEVAGGEIADGLIDEWPGKGAEQTNVTLTRERIRQVMGVDYPDELVESTLTSLGFEIEGAVGGWTVVIPYWRSDISIPEDLIEELARIIGYDELPATTLKGAVPPQEPQPVRDIRRRVVDALTSLGLQQAISYVATNDDMESRINPPGDLPENLGVENPMSSEMRALRRTLRAPVLETAADNSRTWRDPIAIFEAGKVFIRSNGESKLPSEPEYVVGALTGKRVSDQWGEAPGEFDFFDAKGIVEQVLDKLGVEAKFTSLEDATYAEGAAAAIESAGPDKTVLGSVGLVHPEVWDRFDPETPSAVMFELDLGALLRLIGDRSRGDRYAPYIRYPEAPRDLALLLRRDVPVADAVNICNSNRLVKSVSVFDVYEGDGVPQGLKSVGLRVIYQSASGTLRSEQVSRAESQIVNRLERQLGATLRR